MRRLLIILALIGLSGPVMAADPTDITPCESMFADTGMPSYRGDFDEGHHSLRCRLGYVLSHNNETRIPDWVLQELPDSQLTGTAKRKDNFKADDSLLPEHRAEKSDYKGSGFDQGHQAPAADFKSSQQMTDESFLLSNMAPQVGLSFNRGIWAHLEEQVRKWLDTRSRLIVITGPVYDAPDIFEPEVRAIPKLKAGQEGAERVTVPAAFYKIVFDPENGRAIAFLMPNKKLPKRKPSEFRTSIADIEERTGIDFFTTLSKRRQRVLESSVAPMWEH